jgi:heterodisulfide reductase subunit B
MNSEMELDRMRQKCIGSGRCTEVCPSYKHGGCDPREIMLGSDDDINLCISCGKCSQICRRLDPARIIQTLILIREGKTLPATFHETGYVLPYGDTDAPEPTWNGDDICIMPGCIVKCKVPFIENASAESIKSLGYTCKEIPVSTCCTHPIVCRELSDMECRNVKKRMESSADGSKIVTLCGGCNDEMLNTDIESRHMIQFLFDNIESLPQTKKKMRLALEPGCSAEKYIKQMIAVVEKMGFEYIHNEYGCCGKNIDMAEEMMQLRQEAAKDADAIVVGCPMCFLKYDSFLDGKPVLHIGELVSIANGDESSLTYHKIK